MKKSLSEPPAPSFSEAIRAPTGPTKKHPWPLGGGPDGISRPRPPDSSCQPLFMLPATCCPARWPSSASYLLQQVRCVCAARSSVLGPHAKAALAYPFNLPLAATGARGAAKKGEFRVRDFAGFFVFTAEISSTSTMPRAERVQQAQLSAFLCTPPTTSSS